jgi:long-chain acyl-CoA synthetase
MQSMMLYGCKLVLHKRFAAENMLVDIEKYRATLIDGVPTIYMYLLNHSAINTADLSSLDRAYVGGQTMPKAIMEAWSRNLEFP